MNLTDAYASYNGAVPNNIRWGWSGINPDQTTVALTFWNVPGELIFDRSARPIKISYDCRHLVFDRFGQERSWVKHAGNSARKRHITYALEHLDGWVRGILVDAVDPNAEPRSIAKDSARPYHQLWFKITAFDPVTGAFCAEQRDRSEGNSQSPQHSLQ
jgi:hypothetical protein